MATNAVSVRSNGKHSPPAKRAPGRASSRGPNWGRLVAEGRAARAAADTGRWRIGHLASLVAKQYGARSLQAFADDIGESYGTVRRYRWVSTRYEPTVRFRFQQLSFSHFQAVAGLPDRTRWLERAENGCWSVDELVRQSRETTSGGSTRPGAGPASADLRAPILDARTHLRRLAKLEDAELVRASSWLEPMLDELTAQIDRVRGRITSVRGLRVGRYGSNGKGHRAKTNGHNGGRARTRA
jgi:hypothetical protein